MGPVGIEPTTNGLKVRCSTIELRSRRTAPLIRETFLALLRQASPTFHRVGNRSRGLPARIAEQLELSEKTVKRYMTNVLQKLKVRNRVEAALAARKFVN